MGTDTVGDPLAGVDWATTFTEVVALALSLVSKADAQDVANAGIERVFAGQSPWDPQSGVPLARHVLTVGMNARRAEQRKVVRRKQPEFRAKLAIAMEEPTESPENAYASIEERTRLYRLLRAACADDPEALLVLEAEQSGMEGILAQAHHCNVEEAVVRIARDRIGRRLRAILQQERQAEEDAP